MITIPNKVKDRITKGLRKFQKVLATAKDNDINESDTVAIIKDMLDEIFGYDKYAEITSEYAIKSTFCDLAIKKDATPCMLIEVKAIGTTLKDAHTKQALDYGANAAVDWIILTNGVVWKVYRIVFGKPINTELVYEFDMLEISARKQSDLEMVFYLSKEAVLRTKTNTLLEDFQEQKQLISRYMIGQLLLSEDIINTLRRSLRKIAPAAKIAPDEIKQVLEVEVIKREVFDDERSKDAKRRIARAARQAAPKKISSPSDAG